LAGFSDLFFKLPDCSLLPLALECIAVNLLEEEI
jgi:hypothetical protein